MISRIATLALGVLAVSPALPATQTHHSASRYAAATRSVKASNFYLTRWGVDAMVVKAVPSDQLIRFSYRVVNPVKAKTLGTKEAAPQLIDDRRRVALVVPTMDKVGQLRQSGPPEDGKTYWMVFSNKGNVVKRGDRVAIVMGEFHVNGLAVE